MEGVVYPGQWMVRICFQNISEAILGASEKVKPYEWIPYSLDQMPLLISYRSRIVAAPPDVLNEIVAALKY